MLIHLHIQILYWRFYYYYIQSLRNGLLVVCQCRAETILSGVIIRPHPEDANSTRMSLMLQTDMKGWIPHFIVNAFMARAPGNWQSTLTDYYWNVYSKQGQGQAGEQVAAEQKEEKPQEAGGTEP